MKAEFLFEAQRYKTLEDKGMKYLSFVSILAGLCVVLVRYGHTDLSILLLLIPIVPMLISWFFLFKSLEMQKALNMPFDDEAIEKFKNNPMDEVYMALAESYKECAEIKEKGYNKKLKYIRCGYKFIGYSAISFIVYLLIIFVIQIIT